MARCWRIPAVLIMTVGGKDKVSPYRTGVLARVNGTPPSAFPTAAYSTRPAAAFVRTSVPGRLLGRAVAHSPAAARPFRSEVPLDRTRIGDAVRERELQHRWRHAEAAHTPHWHKSRRSHRVGRAAQAVVTSPGDYGQRHAFPPPTSSRYVRPGRYSATHANGYPTAIHAPSIGPPIDDVTMQR